MVDPLSAMLTAYVAPVAAAVATPAGAVTAGVILLVLIKNPKAIKYLLIAIGFFLLFTLGLFSKGFWILAILLFIAYMVLKKK